MLSTALRQISLLGMNAYFGSCLNGFLGLLSLFRIHSENQYCSKNRSVPSKMIYPPSGGTGWASPPRAALPVSPASPAPCTSPLRYWTPRPRAFTPRAFTPPTTKLPSVWPAPALATHAHTVKVQVHPRSKWHFVVTKPDSTAKLPDAGEGGLREKA